MKIALTYTGSEEKHYNYVRWLQDNNPGIEVMTVSTLPEHGKNLDGCDALVLSGGVDVHPSFYGRTIEYPNAPVRFDRDRDDFEQSMFEDSQAKGLPVLAVCRGMQLVNCLLGGTLIQDLGGENAIHRAEGLIDKVHGASIQPGSLLHRIVNTDRVAVNSAHHQAVGKLADDLTITCTADDGTIESIERADPTGKSFLLGVQWHPERMYKFQLEQSGVSKAIRDYFINVVQQSIDKK